jgi:acyl-CoA synthetase
VEAAVMAHPAVALAAAVPVPDPVFGERVCAVVELHAGRTLTLDELVAHLRAQGVSVESWPERLLVLDELPRSSGGKIAKGELRKEAQRRLQLQASRSEAVGERSPSS